MARSTGTMKLSSNFEPRLGAPLDGRMVVPTLADLTTSGNFPYPYKGMIVAVQATCKLYVYNGGTITSSSSWQEVGGSSLSGNVGNTSTPIYLNNGVLNAVAAKFLSANSTGETAITDGQDLNEFTTIGVYGTSGGNTGSSVAGSLLNKPTFAGGFRMYVESCGGDMTYLRQTIITKAGLTFTRTSISLTASPKTWTDWKQVATLSDIPAYTNGTGLSLSGTTFSISQANASTILNLLSVGDSDAQAADYVICQFSGGGTSTTSYHRRPLSKVVNATAVKAALGTVATTANKFLRDDGTWSAVTATDSTKLPLSGGTMTGTLVAKGSVYTDARDQGTLNMNNSNIYGVNAIYMADSSDNAGEGINFINSSTTLDTLWAAGGVLLFTPNRADGTATTAANSQKVGRFTVNPTSGQVVITDGTSGGIKSSGYTIAKSVPSNAVFTDNNTTYTLSTSGNNIVLTPSSGSANSVTAPYATTAGKLGSSTVGSGTKPIYLSSGTATASTSTVGNQWNGTYLSSGTITACESGGSKNSYLSLNHHQGVQVLHITGTYLPSWGYATCKAHVFLADGIACEVLVTLHNYNISAAFPTYKVEYMHARATSNALGVCYNYKTTGTQYWTLDIFVAANSAQASGSTTVYPHVTLLGVYGFGGDPILNIGNFSDVQALSTATGSATKIS